MSDQELAAQKAAREAGQLAADESTCCAAPTSSAAPGSRRSTTRAARHPRREAARGRPGRRRRRHRGRDRLQPGDYLVTNIDARLQSVVEKQLLAAITKRAHAHRRTDTGTGNYKADSGAAVVLDVTNGHVLAMASYPSYDPSVWVGGISLEGVRRAHRRRSRTTR